MKPKIDDVDGLSRGKETYTAALPNQYPNGYKAIKMPSDEAL
jgi:hypothetical protein